MNYPILKPNQSWFAPNVSTIKRSTITTINIADTYTPSGSVTDSWDASLNNDGSIMVYVEGTNLTIAGNGSGKIYANEDASAMFSDVNKVDYFSKLTSIEGMDVLDTSNATTMKGMFNYCQKLKTIDLSSWDVSNVTTIRIMFQRCSALSSIGDISNWNVGKVTDISYLFSYCSLITTLDLSKWNTENVEASKSTFQHMTSLTSLGDLGNWKMGKCKDAGWMFNNCNKLLSLNVTNWDVSQLADMTAMFQLCSSLTTLDVGKWKTSSATSLRGTFYGCTNITTLDLSKWDVSKVTNMNNMFSCPNISGPYMSFNELDLSNWDVGNVTDMSFMFYGCKGPKHLDISKWNVSSVQNFDHMFAHSYLTISDISNWNVSSATNMNAFLHTVQNEVHDVTGWDVSNVQIFMQMFDHNTKLKEIIGLETWDTSSGLGFNEMFTQCKILKKLNLSSFDTRNAKDDVVASANGGKTQTLKDMFVGMNSLEEITLGENFSFDGDGTTTNNQGVLPTTADGNWYTSTYVAYAPEDIPNLTANTYYASELVVDKANSKKYVSLNTLKEYHKMAQENLTINSISEETIEEIVNYEIVNANEVSY